MFEPAEQQDLITLLTSMLQLKSLNLTKEETTKDYNTLVPTLVTLTNLKSLNLINSQITEENRQKLAILAGLELIPAAQPVEDVPAQPAPAPVPGEQPQPAPGEQSPTDSTTQQIQTVALEANPEAPATEPIVPPEENGEPDVTPTPQITPAAPVLEEVVSACCYLECWDTKGRASS